MDSSSYVPLIADEHDVDTAVDVPRRSRCKNVLIYTLVNVVLVMSFAGPLYFLMPHRGFSSSNTVMIVNRYPDNISVYEVSRDGDEKLLANLGPNDRVRLFPEGENQCFVRHRESYFALEQVNKGATIVVGDGPEEAFVSSRSGGQEQVVAFINDEDEPVVISWIDFEGTSIEMSQLQSNEQFDLKTFVDHVFTISSAETHEVIGQFTIRLDAAIYRTRQVVDAEDHPVMVAIENQTSGHVKLMWRDDDGASHVLGDLAPNTKSVVETYVGHELYFLSSDGTETKSTTIVPSVTMLRATEKP